MAALGGSVSKRYARALFSLGVDRGQFEEFGRQLTALAELYVSSNELRQALENPVFKPSEKRAILEVILPRLVPNPEVRHFALLLLERGRLTFLQHIARDYGLMTDDRLGQVRGSITSATPLDGSTFAQITQALEKRTGKKVILEAHVDPELLGGAVAQVGDLILDGSLRTRLDTLSGQLLN